MKKINPEYIQCLDNVVRILIVKEDVDGKRYAMELTGDEAKKWYCACKESASLCWVHGVKFPQLKWEYSD